MAAPVPESLLQLIDELARELHPRRPPRRALDLDASLDRDAGLDSLGRMELLARLERAFGVALMEEAMIGAETPRDLLRALVEAGGAEAAAAGAAAAAVPFAGQRAAEAVPEDARTFLEVLTWYAERSPERGHLRYEPGDGAAEELTYGRLRDRARRVAAGLAAAGVGRGDTVGLMLPSGTDYFAAFCGTLWTGAVPVPLYPPARRSQIEDHLRRQAGILWNAGAGLLVSFAEVLPLARLLRAQVPGVRRVATVAELEGRAAADGEGPEPAAADPEDLAILQYTSGSTGRPKGVALTHANLLGCLRAMGEAAGVARDDVIVSWLPLYHDMGLIGAWMGSLYFGLPLVLLSPLSFLARPVRWLQAIHRHRGTISAAPNFAYDLCVAKIAEEDLAGLDLSSLRLALNGAEAISPATLERFAERFAPCGFRREAFFPVYGLAENTLGLAFPPPGRAPVVDAIDREPFQRSGRAVPAAPGDPAALRFVSCGFPVPGHEIRIVDTAGRELGERRQGRLQFRGPAATSGYYRNPEATRALFDGEWLESGDLAYVAAGEVYLTGRTKDLVIRAGRNIAPDEVEEAVGEQEGVRKGCVAVFGSQDPRSGTERLVVVAETREEDEAARRRLHETIEGVVHDLAGTAPDEVVLAPPHAVPKTSSGKVRRTAARDLYERGKLGAHAAPFWRQVARLGWLALRSRLGWGPSGRLARLAERGRAARDLAYAGWFWLLVGLAFPFVAGGIAVLPGVASRRRYARRVARALRWLAGSRVAAAGLEHLDAVGPCVVAANHASYLDVFVLTAALPPRFAYLAKRELSRQPVPRFLLDRLGTVYVERFDPREGLEDVRRAEQALAAGDSLVVFPEGTFTRAPGLLAFQMGAFVAAARAGVPVVPVAIKGARSLMRGDTWFPRRGAVAVTVGAPLSPEGEGWAEAVRLRDAARAAILPHCGEPDAAGS